MQARTRSSRSLFTAAAYILLTLKGESKDMLANGIETHTSTTQYNVDLSGSEANMDTDIRHNGVARTTLAKLL